MITVHVLPTVMKAFRDDDVDREHTLPPLDGFQTWSDVRDHPHQVHTTTAGPA
ncbi:hypothetical protein [Bradyrhizobium uaiense]|uniref:hypothetical protein n=1 Tax=Bradyrhizobium uaiense TaxID=2594946 RepID=UPI0013D6974D|nr:hypothetical protein [Bradyrhizobium uaiense]